MRALDRPLLADENISPEVVSALRQQGLDVRSAVEEGLAGRDDAEILRRAHAESRVVLTHDAADPIARWRGGVMLRQRRGFRSQPLVAKRISNLLL